MIYALVFALSLADTLTNYTQCYAQAMNLQAWEIEIIFEPSEDIAGTVADPVYLMAQITYDTTQIKRDDEYVRWLVRHELYHVWEWEFAEYAERGKHEAAALRLEEQQASRFARWPAWTGVCR